MGIKDESFIILSIVLHLPKLANSYDLTKIMGWKFDMLNSASILSDLVKDQMVVRNESAPVFIYEITDLGRETVYENLEKNRSSVYKKFTKGKDFLDILFSKF